MDEITLLKVASQAYEAVFNDDLSTFILFAKTIAALFIGVNLFQKLMANYSTSGQAFKKSDSKGFSPQEIFTTFLLLVLVITITDLLNIIDNILTLLADETQFKFEKDLGPWATAAKWEDFPDDVSFTVWDKILLTLENIVNVLSPMALVQALVGALAWILDQMIFIYFLAVRFFVMGIIKLISPLIIALSIIDKFRAWALGLVKIYVRTFLTIIPMLLVAVFAARMYNALYNGLDSIADGAIQTTGAYVVGASTRTPALLLFVFLKFKLYGKCSEIMKSLMP